MRVLGAVTFVTGRNFYLQDQSGGLLVAPDDTLDVKTGDRMEVAGYIANTDFGPELSNATVTRLAAPMVITPQGVHATTVPTRNLASQLVSLKGKLVNASFGQGKLQLTFEVTTSFLPRTWISRRQVGSGSSSPVVFRQWTASPSLQRTALLPVPAACAF